MLEVHQPGGHVAIEMPIPVEANPANMSLLVCMGKLLSDTRAKEGETNKLRAREIGE